MLCLTCVQKVKDTCLTTQKVSYYLGTQNTFFHAFTGSEFFVKALSGDVFSDAARNARPYYRSGDAEAQLASKAAGNIMSSKVSDSPSLILCDSVGVTTLRLPHTAPN